MCALNRQCLHGVTLLMDPEVPCGVTLAFTERTGGFSKGEFASLNLGSRCGDNLQHVQKNRQLVLEALGAGEHFSRLLVPYQVHGSTVVCLSSDTSEAFEQAKTEAEAGADAVVCTVQNTPVLLAFADCVPVILVAPGGFAVAHSGWKGTIARISACTTEVLCQATGAKPSEVKAYIGPHIGSADYEVSSELIGPNVVDRASGERYLDLGYAVRAALIDAGVRESAIEEVTDSTASTTARFFSYRAEHGKCGRHAAVAYMAAK